MTVTTDAQVSQQPNILRALRNELGWSEERAAATAGVSVVLYLQLEEMPVLPESSRGVQSILDSARMRGAVAMTREGRWEVVERLGGEEVSRIVKELGDRGCEPLIKLRSHDTPGSRVSGRPKDLSALHSMRLIEFGAEIAKVVYDGVPIDELTPHQRVRRTALGDAVVNHLAEAAACPTARILAAPEG